MKAAWYDRQGPAAEVLQVGELEQPEPGPGEVLVRVEVSGVNPSDVKLRGGTGHRPKLFDRIIPHSDGAGVIEAVGPGVDPARIGERVWLWNAQWERPFGTAAEYVALPSVQAVHLPESASFEAGACLGIPAITAHRCVFADGPVEGKTVLVTGGAGAVGHYAIQWARIGGAQVIATVSSPEKAKLARAAGAHYVLNYREEDVVACIQDITGGRGVDRVVDVDFGTNLPVTAAVLKPNGVVAAYASMGTPEPVLPFYSLMTRDITIRLVFLYIIPGEARRRAIADINEALASGALIHNVAAVYPLEAIAEAHLAVEEGRHAGNTVVKIR